MSLIVHPECGKQWTGSRREHCPACHQTFNSSHAGNLHRRGTFGADRRCIDPAAAGLIPVAYDWGIVWQTPGSDPRRA